MLATNAAIKSMFALKKWTVDELLAIDKAGLLNPEKRIELIEGELHEMPIGENHASILMRLNNILVPQFADRALVNIQNPLRIKEVLRQGDLLARMGGDEFAVLLASADCISATAAAHRVNGMFDTPFTLGDQAIHAQASLGVGALPRTRPDPRRAGPRCRCGHVPGQAIPRRYCCL